MDTVLTVAFSMAYVALCIAFCIFHSTVFFLALYLLLPMVGPWTNQAYCTALHFCCIELSNAGFIVFWIARNKTAVNKTANAMKSHYIQVCKTHASHIHNAYYTIYYTIYV